MSGNKVMLDTNALGPYLDGKFAKEYVKPKEIVFISIISQLEFLSNPQLTPKNRFFFEEFCEIAEIYSLTKENRPVGRIECKGTGIQSGQNIYHPESLEE